MAAFLIHAAVGFGNPRKNRDSLVHATRPWPIWDENDASRVGSPNISINRPSSVRFILLTLSFTRLSSFPVRLSARSLVPHVYSLVFRFVLFVTRLAVVRSPSSGLTRRETCLIVRVYGHMAKNAGHRNGREEGRNTVLDEASATHELVVPVIPIVEIPN